MQSPIPEDAKILTEETFQVTAVNYETPDGNNGGAVLIATKDGKPLDFVSLMMSAEYLTALVAIESNAGYEKALELVTQGAMTYVHKLQPPKDGQ